MRWLIAIGLLAVLVIVWWLVFRVALRDPNLSSGADIPSDNQHLGGGGHG